MASQKASGIYLAVEQIFERVDLEEASQEIILVELCKNIGVQIVMRNKHLVEQMIKDRLVLLFNNEKLRISERVSEVIQQLIRTKRNVNIDNVFQMLEAKYGTNYCANGIGVIYSIVAEKLCIEQQEKLKRCPLPTPINVESRVASVECLENFDAGTSSRKVKNQIVVADSKRSKYKRSNIETSKTTCPVAGCGDTFKMKSSQYKHCRTYHGVWSDDEKAFIRIRFQCFICGQICLNKSNLSSHSRCLHPNEPVRGQQIKQRSQNQDSRSFVTQPLPVYECYMCALKFFTRADASKHMRKHVFGKRKSMKRK